MAKSRKRQESAQTSERAAGPDQGARGYPSNGESRARIAMRAYELYLARGGIDGGDFDDWIAAERELRASTARLGPNRGE